MVIEITTSHMSIKLTEMHPVPDVFFTRLDNTVSAVIACDGNRASAVRHRDVVGDVLLSVDVLVFGIKRDEGVSNQLLHFVSDSVVLLHLVKLSTNHQHLVFHDVIEPTNHIAEVEVWMSITLEQLTDGVCKESLTSPLLL
jgi:hypothetical protein